MNLLIFNLATDADHVTLGFALRWIKELSNHFDHIDVVTMYEGRHDLPGNVTVWSVGREKGYSEIRRIWRFYCIIARILKLRRIDVVFTHMIYIFAVLFWPIAKVSRIKNVLWYAHGTVPFGLRVAHLAVDKVVTPTKESFRISSNKVDIVGHGINANLFKSDSYRDRSAFHIISVSRISPVKGLDILIEALTDWRTIDGRPWELTIVGSATSESERKYEADFIRRALSLQKYGKINLLGRLDEGEVAHWLNKAEVFINLSATGSLDKAIIEAMASGCVVLSCNDAFSTIARNSGFSECCINRSSESVKSALGWVAGLRKEQWEGLSIKMQDVAMQGHSLDRLILKLEDILNSMSRTASDRL